MSRMIRRARIPLLVVTAFLLASLAPTPGAADDAAPGPGVAPRLVTMDGRSVEDMVAATGLNAMPGLDTDAPAPASRGAAPTGGSGPTATGGHALWSARYQGNAAGWSITNDIAVDPSGRMVYVTGESVSAGTWQKFVTVAYDATTGAQVWEARYSGSTIYSEIAMRVATSPEGSRVYVTGYGQNPGTGLDYTTIAYDAATGTRLWVTHYSGPGGGWDIPMALLVSPDGGTLYVSGYSEIGTTWAFNAATVALDAANGQVLWSHRYAGPGGQAYGLDATLSENGERLYVTGMRWSPSAAWDFVTLAYDTAGGALLWDSAYDGPASGTDLARGVAVSKEGTRVYIGGESEGIGTRSDLATIGYDAATGAELWVSRYDGPSNHYEWSRDVALTPDGETVVIGGSSVRVATVLEYVALAYNTADGSLRWLYEYDGPGNEYDEVRGMKMSATGDRLYLTGQSWSWSTAYDMATVAVDTATGAEIWVARFDGTGNRDYGTQVAMDPLGLRVIATGYGRGTSGDLDYITASYLLDEVAIATGVTGLIPDV
jgi:hypothetical protein